MATEPAGVVARPYPYLTIKKISFERVPKRQGTTFLSYGSLLTRVALRACSFGLQGDMSLDHWMLLLRPCACLRQPEICSRRST